MPREDIEEFSPVGSNNVGLVVMADLKLLCDLFRSRPLNRSCEHAFNEQDVIREVIGRRYEIIGITVKDLPGGPQWWRHW